ncbi:MAG: hypothetical protein E6K99_06790 [Thaumarchaeota archaeon]|nr:MAG: hypothetical protein E6K96_09135 [Nitrososphaerota archaeon]TMP98741.1 MAG: hypothetical protein E6K99_06790 [Nitrososphaerota archaeon]
MRIYGFFRFGPLEAAYIRARLYLPKLGIDRHAEFLIDTGATRTTISDRDALWLGIDYRRLQKTNASMGIGGSVASYVIKDVTLFFATEVGELFE